MDKRNKNVEIWLVQNDTGKLLKQLVKNSKNPIGYIKRRINTLCCGGHHLVATDFNDFYYEKYHN